MIKILIVDDTKSVHAFLQNLLKKSTEVEYVSVFDGAQALDILQKKTDFDMILLDWEMPNLNGPETLAAFKRAGVNTPVMMMTTKNAPEDIARMLDRGAVEYLMKPFTADILFEKIEYVIGRPVAYAA